VPCVPKVELKNKYSKRTTKKEKEKEKEKVCASVQVAQFLDNLILGRDFHQGLGGKVCVW